MRAVNTRSPNTFVSLLARGASGEPNSANRPRAATAPGRRAASVARSALPAQGPVGKEPGRRGRALVGLLTNSPCSQWEAWSTFPPANREGDKGCGGRGASRGLRLDSILRGDGAGGGARGAEAEPGRRAADPGRREDRKPRSRPILRFAPSGWDGDGGAG